MKMAGSGLFQQIPAPKAPEAPSVARSFFLLWVASLLVPALIFMAAAVWSWRSVKNEAHTRLNRNVDMLHEHALRAFEAQAVILQALAQRRKGMTWDAIAASPDIHEFLKGMKDSVAPLGGIVMLDDKGHIRSADYEFPARSVDLNDRDYVKVHRAGENGTYIGKVIVTKPLERTVFTITRRLNTPEGAFDGVVVTSLKPDYFTQFYRSITESEGDAVTMMREDGLVLARTPLLPDEIVHNNLLYTGPVFKAIVSDPDGNRIMEARSSLDGKKRLYNGRKVGSYPVYVLYGLDPAVIRHAWMRQLVPYGMVSGLASLLLLGLTARLQGAVRKERLAFAAARQEAERRAEAEAQLRHIQKVEGLGQLVGGVAHDFKNLIQSVHSGMRRITRVSHDPREVERTARLVESAITRGEDLTAKMLNFVRRDEADTGPADLAVSLKALGDLLERTLEAGYHLDMALPDALPKALVSKTEFETVIMNLVFNARDAMPEGGTITIRVSAEAESAADRPESLPPGTYSHIAVIDHGVGMDEDTRARLGEAFFTTKPPGQGTGLGLAMAKGFAERAGGALTIASDKGKGTTISLWLPAAGEALS